MCWSGIIDGTVLSLHWFQDDNESPTTDNNEIYRAMFENLMWGAVKIKAIRKGYFLMQDGAPPPHYTNVALQFLKEKFRGRVINKRSEIIWPAHSPNMNPLDFWFWGYVESQPISKNPRNINEMKV